MFMERLEDLLAELGWSRLHLAKKLSLHRNTVYKWKVVPKYVIAYLEMAVEIKRLGDILK